ncbi:hypothetical protein [uncultured Thiodictyon sp.]|uniref:hypothetical protein n=1 Tax=uncultured Thiodictyon sp. TaxID=1846217 RepID=UPI0025E3D237|nr:hypothetical protein [uncultured Thiodictyon sp.]
MTVRLPVSAEQVTLREPGGRDELLLAAGSGGFALRLEAVRRLAPPLDPAIDWDQLPLADLDAALLAVRRRLIGERLMAEVRCAGCGTLGDVGFTVSDYLAAHAPNPPRGLERDDQGWYVLGQTRLRIPTVAAYRAAAQTARSMADLAARLEDHCIGGLTGADRRRALRTLERVAPLLGGEIAGQCPACEAPVYAWFEPGDFVLSELRQRAAGLYEEVHLLASVYHWSEQAILALPASRRSRYAQLSAARGAAPGIAA